MDFLFLPVPKKKMGFLFQTKCRKYFTHFWMFTNKLSSLYTLFELCAENRIENESVEKESIRVRHLGFQCEKQQTLLHLLHMCVWKSQWLGRKPLFVQNTQFFFQSNSSLILEKLWKKNDYLLKGPFEIFFYFSFSFFILF